MDKAGFKSIFDEYYSPLKNFLYYKLGDADLAEDLTQEVFLKSWNNRDNIRLDTIKSYLYTIANNLAINHYKSARTRFEFGLKSEDSEHQQTPQYKMEESEFEEHLKASIAKLTENQRVVFLMNRIDDLTYKEIAERLEISVKAVEKRMHKALEFLRHAIEYKI